MKYYVYILKSEQFCRYYIGTTHDLKLRLERHNSGRTVSTKRYVPWEIKYVEEYEDKRDALRREREIKRRKSRVYIERLINAGGRPVPK